MLEELKETIGPDTPEIIVELIDSYLQEAPQELAEMRRALSHKNIGVLWQAAHTLKSSSAIFGAARLSALCAELEVMGRTGVTQGADRMLTQMEAEFGQLKPLLERERSLCLTPAGAYG